MTASAARRSRSDDCSSCQRRALPAWMRRLRMRRERSSSRSVMRVCPALYAASNSVRLEMLFEPGSLMVPLARVTGVRSRYSMDQITLRESH